MATTIDKNLKQWVVRFLMDIEHQLNPAQQAELFELITRIRPKKRGPKKGVRKIIIK